MAYARRLCEPCLSENVQEEASVYCYDCNEKLCDTCGKVHKKFKTSKDHKIGDLLNVPFVIAEKFLDSLVTCQCHTAERAVVFCNDHDIFCCKECAEMSHRDCMKVDPEALHATLKLKGTAPDWTEIKAVVELREKQVNELIEHESAVVQQTANLESDLDVNLQMIKASLDDAFRQLEMTVKHEFRESKVDILKSAVLQRESAERLKEELNDTKGKIDLIDNHGNEIHRVLFGRFTQNRILDNLVETIDRLYDSATMKAIESTMSELLEDVAKGIRELIHVRVFDKKASFLFKPPAEKIPNLLASLNLRDKSYKDWFYPESCVWVGDFIVISVSGQNVVKLVDATSYKVVDTFVCSSEPLAVCVMDDSLVGVWLPKDVQTEVMAIEDGHLKRVNVIELPCKARDIQYNKETGHIVALCRDEGSIKLLDKEGECVGTLPLDKKLTDTVEDCLRFKLGKENQVLYISGYCMHRLVAINLNGEEIFDYKHNNLKYPVGCDLDEDGNIFVASWKGQSIHEINKSGEHKRVLLEGDLYYPQSICFNDTKDKFAVIHTLAESHLHIYSFES